MPHIRGLNTADFGDRRGWPELLDVVADLGEYRSVLHHWDPRGRRVPRAGF